MNARSENGQRTPQSCVVIGAGMAGLTAARTLSQAGVEVTVLEKSRGVGGRMAARRAAGAVFDHGAQYVTVDDQRFGSAVASWVRAGLLLRWASPSMLADGNFTLVELESYIGARGMTTVPKAQAAMLKVALSERVTMLEALDGAWKVTAESGSKYIGDAVVLTAPVPQSLELLRASGIDLGEKESRVLDDISYEPCIAVMAVADGPGGLPESGGLLLQDSPIYWIADNTKKGISPTASAFTLLAAPEFSAAHFDDDLPSLTRFLLEAAREWIGEAFVHSEAHRWRYSKPTKSRDENSLLVNENPPLVLAGDALVSPKVEGAFLSGLHAAGRFLLRRS